MARDLRQQGELDEARERLEQAAIQLQSLVPTNAQRRTVFGLQARLAMTFAEDDQIEVADEYADELFALAEAEPELGDAALVTLAYSVAERRQTAAEAANEPASQLDLFRIALRTAQAGAPTRERMNLAYQVSAQAYREGELALAREAIEQSIADATRISPTYLKEIAGMQLFRARIALAQDDFVAAESAATRANLIFEEISAEAAQRGVGEAVLAEALAEQGQLERALAVASGAHARLELGEPIAGPARRQILASLARVERTRGDLAAARIHFEEALAIEASQNELDQMLVESIALELQTLRDSGSADVSEVD
jgi:hypothetical protein